MFKIRLASRHPSQKAIQRMGQMPKFPKRVRIRFGSTIPHSRVDYIINKIDAIKNTANKMTMKRLLSAAGVNTPKYFLNDDAGRNAIMEGHLGEKIFFKTPYHSRGRGMVMYDTKESAMTQLNKGYFEESKISWREYRVHVMDGEVFYVDEKRPKDQSMKLKDRPIVKNMSNGFKFRRPLADYPDEVHTESVKAVEALGLDFGGVDVGVTKDGEVVIYEVNSAPSLRTKTRKLYQKALVKLIWKKILGDTQEAAEKSMDYNKWLDEQPLTE